MENTTEKQVRIDKWLWAVRIFKTRSEAADACSKGKVFINEVAVKSSRIVKLNELINVRQNPIIRTFRVKGIIINRVSAKLAPNFVEDITAPEELSKLEMVTTNALVYRDRGAGRPTKKERRFIDKFRGSSED